MLITMTQSIPDYDPVTLVQWLWWKLRCYEASPQEFQQLFEKIASRLRPDFIKVRPYGNLGDRKCDGLFWGDGTVFQVYSPDELKQAKTVAKIQEDLEGAIAEWGDQLKKWVFVYNTRVGVAPDIPLILLKEKKKYSSVEIQPLSSEALWELMRELTTQQRAEIIGAPAGHEHLFLLPSTLPEEAQTRLREGRFVVVQDIISPINVKDIVKALEPEKPFGPPLHVRPSSLEVPWEISAAFQSKIVSEALERSRRQLPRFAVFSLAPIPLAIHLGYLFSDRVELAPFQYVRDRETWCWDTDCEAFDVNIRMDGLPPKEIVDDIEVTIRVSLSAKISPGETNAVAQTPVQIDLFVDQPDVMWLCHPDQLSEFSRRFLVILRDLRRLIPNCRRIHLFYAGPTGGAIVMGQTINPRMNPPVALYEYDRQKTPHYQHVLTLPS